MTKGPVAVVLAAVPALLAFRLRSDEWRACPHKPGLVLVATGIFALVVVPWHVAAVAGSGMRFFDEYAGTLTWRRYLEPVHFPGAGLIVYPVFLLTGLLPWAGLLPPAIVSAWRRRREQPAGFFLGGYAAWVVLFFAASPGPIFMRYMLPALPAASVLIGAFLDRPERGLLVQGAVLSVLTALLVLLAAAGLPATLPGAHVLRLTLAILATSAAIGGILLLKGSARAAVFVTAAGAVAAYVSFLAMAPPVVASLLPERDFARHVNALEHKGARLAVFRPESLESMLAFYVRSPIVRADDEQSLARFISEHDLAFVVERPGAPLPSAARRRLAVVSSTPGATLLSAARAGPPDPTEVQ